MENRLLISANPHIRDKESVRRIMMTVNITLIPALIASYIFFGYKAILLTAVSILAAVGTEAAVQKFRGVKITVSDGSAVITGVLMAFHVSAGTPWWVVALGSVFAIAIAKQAFGGLGYNFINPALAGRAFMMASWPVEMTSGWPASNAGTYAGKASEIAKQLGGSFDALSTATPLNVMKAANKIIIENADADKVEQAKQLIFALKESYWDSFIGNTSGCIGETSELAILIGGLFLIFKGYVNWRVPLFYILTVAVMAWLLPNQDPMLHILSGGLFIGAFYMATDMVTSPITNKGLIIFAIGCGVLTMAIRVWGGYPEGVSYAILLMNIAAPLIDRFAVPKKFGYNIAKKG
jgi:electron transport complex protein RnfD